MAASSRRETTSPRSTRAEIAVDAAPAVGVISVIPLGGDEPPDALTRALALLDRPIAIRPALDALLESALVVFCGRDTLLADAITSLRGSRGALLPVLAVVEPPASAWIDPSWRCLADDAIAADGSVAAIAASLESLLAISGAVRGLPPEDPARSESDRRRTRLLRALLTREAAIVPARAAASPTLFRYGLLEGIAGAGLAADLDALSARGLLAAEHADRVYRCACGDARLHFRDACEHCRATALETAHVLRHHCGHAASSGEFWKGEELVCPACGEQLKTAGDDYEGPLDEIRCRACGKAARAGLTIATCAGCGETTAAEKLSVHAVHGYALTAAGRAAALAAPAHDADPSRRTALLAAWKKAAVARPRASLALVRVSGVPGAHPLDRLLAGTLRGNDHALPLDNGFLALLTDTGRDGAKRFVDRIAAAGADREERAPAAARPLTQILVFPEEQAEIEAVLKSLADPGGA